MEGRDTKLDLGGLASGGVGGEVDWRIDNGGEDRKSFSGLQVFMD